MSVVNVTFDIPQWIQQGLTNNEYELFGSVIREATTGKIVAHLRETSSCINQALSGLHTAGSFASILNTGVSIVGFTLILNKLNDIENRILNIENSIKNIEFKIENINYKIDLNFRSELIGALNQLNKALSVDELTIKKQLVINLSTTFEKSKEIFSNLLTNYSKNFKNLDTEGDLLIVIHQSYIFTYLSYVGLSLCYLEMEQLNLSKQILQDGYKFLKSNYEKVILESENYDSFNANDLEEQEEFIVECVELFGLERLTTTSTDFFGSLFGFEQLKPDHEIIYMRNQEKLEYIKKVIKEFRPVILSLESFLEEIKYIQQLELTWSKWKEIKPDEYNYKAEYMYIIPCRNTSIIGIENQV